MEAQQGELPLPFPELTGDMPLLPARMVNEYQYCPRLAYLEWVQGEWADSADTVDGARTHQRVDRGGGRLPVAEELAEDEHLHARSITLSSNRLGLIAKLDLIEAEGGQVVPVDYKRGKRPHVEKGAYEPERIQLCVQGMILEDHGYDCREGVLYFAGSKERVKVPFDEELRALSKQAVDGLRFTADGGRIPPPLQDSPKCPRCSLVGICLPDEVNYVREGGGVPRPITVPRDEALPVYVQSHRAKVSKSGEVLEISVDDSDTTTKARLIETSELVLMGNVYLTTPGLHELLRRDIPVSWYSYGGWFLGHTQSTGHKNVELRTAQYRISFDTRNCLRIARGLVAAKIRNAGVLLRRNWRQDSIPEDLRRDLKNHEKKAQRARDIESLLGIEGAAAARCFGEFSKMIKSGQDVKNFSFDFTTRNRRPPTDPVNALLSFAYAVLTRIWTNTLSAVGFDPYRGYYHQPRYGRPSLALDMMEPFRPLIADSSVIQAINNGEIKPTDFISAAGSVALNASGRKRFIATIERRVSQEVTHPLFGYRASYRRVFHIQARLLARHLLGEIPDYPNFLTR